MGIPLWKGPSSSRSSTNAERAVASPPHSSTSGIRRRPAVRPLRRSQTPSSQTLFDLLRGEASTEPSRISARLWHEMIAAPERRPPPPPIHRALPLGDYDTPSGRPPSVAVGGSERAGSNHGSIDALMRNHWSLRHVTQRAMATMNDENEGPPVPHPRLSRYAGFPPLRRESWHGYRPPTAIDGLGDRERSLSPDEVAAQWDLVANDLGLATACEDLWDSDAEVEEGGAFPVMWALRDRTADEATPELERMRLEEAREMARDMRSLQRGEAIGSRIRL